MVSGVRFQVSAQPQAKKQPVKSTYNHLLCKIVGSATTRLSSSQAVPT